MKTKKVIQNTKQTEENLNKNPSEIDKKPGLFVSSFSKTLGIVLAIIIIIASLALVIYLVALGHDKYTGSQYEKQPSYSKDNQWGGLAVNVVIDKKEIRNPIPDKIRDCSTSDSKALQDFAIKFGLTTKPCVPGEKYGGFEGSVYLEGRINVKSDFWLDSKVIPTNLLTFNYDGRQVKPKLEKNIFGSYLNSGQGTSTKFTYEERYSAKDFQLYLNDGIKSALIIGDTVVPDYK